MDARILTPGTSTNKNRQDWLARLILAIAFLAALIIAFGILKEPKTIDGLVVFGRQTRGHDDLNESQTGEKPPVGGIHHSQLLNCGIYSSPVKPEMAFHSMEHGAVWITYQPEISPQDIDFLQEMVRGQEYLILSPFPGQKSALMLTAWGFQLSLNSVSDPRAIQFISRYRLGPTTPERGGTCNGGFGDPLP